MVNKQCFFDALRLCRPIAGHGSLESCLDEGRYSPKVQPAGEKFGDSDFIRGVEHGRRGPALFQRPACKRQRWKILAASIRTSTAWQATTGWSGFHSLTHSLGSTMTALVQAVSSLSNARNVETLKTLAMFCGGGLIVSLLVASVF